MMADLEEDVESDVDFNSGYAGTMTAEKPPTTAPATTDTTAEKVEPGAEAAAESVTPPAPEYVQLTKEELAIFRAAASKTDGLDKLVRDAVAGTLGNVEQRLIKKLNLAPAATQTADPPPPTPESQEQDRWQGMVHEASVKYQIEALEDEHPTWRTIVGQDKDGNIDKASPFRIWLAAQPAEYQAKIENSNSASVIARAITKFNEAAAKAAATAKQPITPSPKVVARKAVISNAQQPRGDGGQPAPAKTDDDHFAEGFAVG